MSDLMAIAMERHRECWGSLEPEHLLGETPHFVVTVSRVMPVGRLPEGYHWPVRHLVAWNKTPGKGGYWIERIYRNLETGHEHEMRWLNCALSMAKLLRENINTRAEQGELDAMVHLVKQYVEMESAPPLTV